VTNARDIVELGPCSWARTWRDCPAWPEKGVTRLSNSRAVSASYETMARLANTILGRTGWPTNSASGSTRLPRVDGAVATCDGAPKSRWDLPRRTLPAACPRRRVERTLTGRRPCQRSRRAPSPIFRFAQETRVALWKHSARRTHRTGLSQAHGAQRRSSRSSRGRLNSAPQGRVDDRCPTKLRRRAMRETLLGKAFPGNRDERPLP
jgi:hypothetical protein